MTLTHTQTNTSNKQQNSNQAATKRQLHPVLVKLFQKRKMSPQDVQEFLSWDLKGSEILTNLKDLDKASARIIQAMEKKQKIGIYGDYDVDGTTSCALLHHFFNSLNYEVDLVQPSRFIEGYGIHPSAIDQALEKGIELLITVDCGITNSEAALYAREKKLDLIITDHHKDALDEMPNAFAVINPNRRDEPEDSPLRSIAGVTVAFALALKVREDLMSKGVDCPSLYPLLQFVAIGTICDLVPLNELNVRLTRHGLKQIPNTQFPGVKVFFPPEERKQSFIPSEKLSFLVGPMINSKGRLDHPEKALKLLISEDIEKAYHYYNHLEIANKERKYIQSEVFEQARKQVLKDLSDEDHPISIVYDSEWHEGVIGIVASKLVESFRAPAIVFTDSEDKDIIKASARTAGELSIFDCLKKHEDLFLKFGGHKAAAGLSMPKENFEEFKRSMTELVKSFPLIERTVQDYYDLDITPEEIDPKLVKDLELLEPYGMGNAKPLFKMSKFKLDSFNILKDVHVRWSFRGIDRPEIKLGGISFNYIGKFGALHPEELYSLAQNSNEGLTAFFTLGINRFNGNEYIQLMVDRITPKSY